MVSAITDNPSELGSIEVFLAAVNLEEEVKNVSKNASVSTGAHKCCFTSILYSYYTHSQAYFHQEPISAALLCL